MQQRSRFNWETAVKALILLGFSGMLLYLVVSGRIRMYVNPRFAILSGIAAAALFLMFVVQLLHPPEPHHAHDCCCQEDDNPKWGYAIFIVPLVLFLILPNATLDASLAANRGLGLNSAGAASGVAASNSNQAAANGGNSLGSGALNSIQDSDIDQGGLIQMSDANFVRVVTTLNQSPERYAGREIAMLGFVSRENDFAPQEFGLIRFVITCCTADASPGGFICQLQDAAKYKDGTWLEIRGTIEPGSYEGQSLPMIQVSSVKQAVQPSDPYVYP